MATKIYHNPEAAVTFAPSGGDVTFTPTSLSNADARVSAQYDRGSGAKPGLYRWFLKTKGTSSLTNGNVLAVYLSQAKDATDMPGRVGTSDATIATALERLRNLTPIGQAVVDSAGTSAVIASGTCFIYARYVSVVWYNNFGVALSSTGSDHEFILQPIPPESQ